MKRLYLGYIARATHYHAAYDGHEAEFVLQLQIDYRIEGIYKSPTFNGIVEQLKTDGYQVWGTDILDYAIPPRNALEYKLMESYLQSRGFNETDIAEAFSLNIHKAAHANEEALED